jgi:hypothetical protein
LGQPDLFAAGGAGILTTGGDQHLRRPDHSGAPCGGR